MLAMVWLNTLRTDASFLPSEMAVSQPKLTAFGALQQPSAPRRAHDWRDLNTFEAYQPREGLRA
jgi:hypothetical protein